MTHMRQTARLALALLAGAALSSRAQAPELPRAVPTAIATSPGTVRSVAGGGDVQAAIAAARPGDVVEFPCAGQTYSGNYTLPNKGSGTGWITLRPACHASLPTGRMTPALAAALRLPKFVAPNPQAVFTTEPGAHHYRLLGLEIAGGYPPASGNALVVLGSDAQATLAEIPHDFILDRLYLHGTPSGTLRRCVALNSAMTAIVESTCLEAHEAGADNQAIMGWTGPGPYLIRNNYLEAGAEVIMFGGGDPVIPGLIPCDITVAGNYITRPVAWRGGPWLIKNLFELKNACRVLVEGNVLANNWAWGQDGTAVVLKSTNQGGPCIWCGTSHVTFRLNVVRNVGGAFNLAARPESSPADPMHDVLVADNVIANVRTETFTGPGQAFFVQENVAGLTITHNTAVSRTPLSTLVLMPFGTPPMQRLRFTDNVATSAEANYGIFGGNTGPGLEALAAYAPTAVVTGNLLGGMNQYGDYDRRYPAGNRFARTTGDVGFVDSTIVARLDSAALGDLLAALALRPGSAHAGAATDGRDPGANIAAVIAATANAIAGGAVTPAPGPTPVPVPVTITVSQLRAALAALEKVTGPTGREALAIKAPLVPLTAYVRALLAAAAP